jgi:hypothetical protein
MSDFKITQSRSKREFTSIATYLMQSYLIIRTDLIVLQIILLVQITRPAIVSIKRTSKFKRDFVPIKKGKQ